VNAAEIIVIRTGTANLASVMAALERVGADARTSNDTEDIERAERVVLPGVGAFGAAIDRLEADGLVGSLRMRIDAGRPTLASCLGMQLLFEGSDESPGRAGLGAAPGTLRRFTGNVRIPQMGWNCIVADDGCRVLQTGYVYFANSYRATGAPAGWSVATAHYGEPFLAAIERGAVVACQFHPELSGSAGLELISRWLSMGADQC
jgi:imidazole glycerol phosphate synthase glutamine amidotransferase subunit